MTTDTNAALPVTDTASLERSARLLRESLSHCRRDVSIPLKDAHVRNLIKRVEHGRAHPVEHIVTLLWDAHVRQAPSAAVESFPRALLALVQSWSASGVSGSLDLPTLIRRETEAQAMADVCEIEVALCPHPKAIADATERLTMHLNALGQLVDALNRQQVSGERLAA